jgi:hypothetical protein
MKMYEVSKYESQIEELDVTRFNETSYWVGKRRHSRFTNWESVFATWTDARDHIKDRLTTKITHWRSEIADAEAELVTVAEMVDPTISS